MPSDTPVQEPLRLARDLCLGVGAFFVTAAGTVFSNVADVMRPDDAENRIAVLARNCLSHPAAHGSALFWSAEALDESGAPMPDCSLACVVAPVWAHGSWIGLLGVVDVWLPELDEEQRVGLLALAQSVGEQLPAPDAAPAGASGPGEIGTMAAGGPSGGTPAAAVPGAGAPGGGAGAPAPEGEPFLGEILDNLPAGLVVTRADGTIVLVNQTFAAMTGLSMDAVLGEDVGAVLSPPDPAGAPGWSEARGGAERTEGLAALLGREAPGASVAVAAGDEPPAVFDATGRRLESRFAGDSFITLLRSAAAATGGGRADAGIQALLDHVEDGIVCCDAEGTVVVANRAARRLQGLVDTELVVGTRFPEETALRTATGQPVAPDAHPLVRAMHEEAPVNEDLVLDVEGRIAHVAISARPLRVDGGDGAIAVLRDVTRERERQEHLTHYALHDPLTGVANRYLLNDALGRMLDGLVRRGGFVSLIYLDLDGFKAINDEHGHEMGDEVLRAVARRLERAVRGEDVVARLGGDEFVVAHVTADRLSDGDAVVARIRKVLSAPYRFGDLVLDVGASIGWVSTSSGGDSPEMLMSRADRAMYDHKHRRRAAGEEVPA